MSAYKSVRYISFRCCFTQLETNLHVVNDWSKVNVHRNRNHNFKARLCYIYFRVIVDFDPNSIYWVPLTWSMAFDPPPYMHADTVKQGLDWLRHASAGVCIKNVPTKPDATSRTLLGQTPHTTETKLNLICHRKQLIKETRFLCFFFNHCWIKLGY